MILFHRTGPEGAEDILKNGFVNGQAYIELAGIAGVWLSDRPLDCSEGANGEVLLEVRIGLHEADWPISRLWNTVSRIGNGAYQLRSSIEVPVGALSVPMMSKALSNLSLHIEIGGETILF